MVVEELDEGDVFVYSISGENVPKGTEWTLHKKNATAADFTAVHLNYNEAFISDDPHIFSDGYSFYYGPKNWPVFRRKKAIQKKNKYPLRVNLIEVD